MLTGDGEMATLMRTHDWSATPVGPVQGWPQPLRTVIRLMLNTRHPMYVFWGPSLSCFYNDAYRAMIGPERHPGSLGRPAREVWAEIWDTIGPQIDLVMSGRGATWHENQLIPITRNGRLEDVYWTYGYSPIDDAAAPTGVGGVLVLCTETTGHMLERQTLEQRVQTETATRTRTEQVLQQAQKMEAVGQLTGGIAHDFNNMLQGVTSGITLARRRLKAANPEAAAHYLDLAEQAAARAATLTQRLLAFGRRQPQNPRPVSLNDLVRGLQGLIRRTMGPEIQIDIAMQDDCWPVRCDFHQMESALLNLAINARDAMQPGGGRLGLTTAPVTLDETDVAGSEGAAAGDYVRLTISDTGRGMPADVMAHAFEPFFTTKPAGQGTGLGLSQVHGFVRQSRGIIRLDSRPGAGTSVHVFLPRAEPVASDTDAGAAPPETRRAPVVDATAMVLLVEDEAAVRSSIAETLRQLGYRIAEATDGPSGLAELQRMLVEPDAGRLELLVTDIGLPGGLNGRQLAKAARAALPGLPVLLITGYAGDAEGHGELEPGMEILAKPFQLDALADRVQSLVSRNEVFLEPR